MIRNFVFDTAPSQVVVANVNPLTYASKYAVLGIFHTIQGPTRTPRVNASPSNGLPHRPLNPLYNRNVRNLTTQFTSPKTPKAQPNTNCRFHTFNRLYDGLNRACR